MTFVRYRDDYYSYGRVFDRVQELGGVSGFAHHKACRFTATGG